MVVDIKRIENLPCWSGSTEVEPLEGGLTNTNIQVRDSSGKFVVRVGADIVQHHVLRFNELAVARAASEAGLSPRIVHHEPEIMVMEFIEGQALDPKDVGSPQLLSRIIELVKKFHFVTPKLLRGPVLMFWVFHVIRDYGGFLVQNDSPHQALVGELVELGNGFEAASAPYDIVLGHNDLLAANFIDDGNRLWLIDFDYAGYNSPLFDLGGLSSNNELSEELEKVALETYFEAAVTDELLYRFEIMKCASLLRETMWSMVSELTSDLDFDFTGYTAENLARFRAAHDNLSQR
ncbi:MAG: phosphotransferase [Rhizobiaceae bacterium]|nr:phosphotransferase [Rhizobiaceae bacterium]